MDELNLVVQVAKEYSRIIASIAAVAAGICHAIYNKNKNKDVNPPAVYASIIAAAGASTADPQNHHTALASFVQGILTGTGYFVAYGYTMIVSKSSVNKKQKGTLDDKVQ